MVSDIAMLRHRSVTDFATIEQHHIELGPGFSVLTGETGAGKSIIMDALGLLLEGRANVCMVRSGARQSRVEGIFLLGGDTSKRISATLYEHGIDVAPEPPEYWDSNDPSIGGLPDTRGSVRSLAWEGMA